MDVVQFQVLKVKSLSPMITTDNYLIDGQSQKRLFELQPSTNNVTKRNTSFLDML